MGKCQKVLLKLEPNMWQWLYRFQNGWYCGSWDIKY